MKKRVLMVSCNGLGNGGVQNVMMNIIRNLSDKYVFDILLFTDERRCYDEEAEKYGKIYRIPNNKTRIDYYIRFPRILLRTYRLLKSNKYDVIHCNNGYESGICLLAAKIAKVENRVVHSHMVYDYKKGNFIARIINRFYMYLLNCCSTRRIACSKNAGNSIYFKSFDVITNSIDLSRFDISKRKQRNQEVVNFIHIGYFSELKNQAFIVKTLSLLRKIIPNISLVLIGYGDEYKEKIVAEIENLDMKDFVSFLPSDTDVEAALAVSDYMIFPSKNEGLGISLLEAQAMGVYCFASTGVPAEANAGLCEFLDLDSGHKMWAKRIVECIQNKENKGYAQNINDYSLEVMCKKISTIYGGER